MRSAVRVSGVSFTLNAVLPEIRFGFDFAEIHDFQFRYIGLLRLGIPLGSCQQKHRRDNEDDLKVRRDLLYQKWTSSSS